MKHRVRRISRSAAIVMAGLLPAMAFADLGGTVTLPPGTALNLDTGATSSSGGDILLTAANKKSPAVLDPQGNATFYLVPGSFDEASFNALSEANLETFAPDLVGVALSAGLFVAGSVVVVLTNEKHYAKLLVTSNDGSSLGLQYTTFGAAAAGGGWPTISSVVNAASLQPGIAPNTWVTIKGSNLAGTTDNWNNSIVNGALPTAVDNVQVTIGGMPAYVYYISPGQLNALAPYIPTGSVDVTVTTSAGTSTTFTTTGSDVAPAFFSWPGNQVVATRQDFSLAVKAGTFPGTTTMPAAPGQVIILWATGLGVTNPLYPTGQATPSDTTYSTVTIPTVTINNREVMVLGAALTPGSAGLYQIAIQLPDNIGTGDLPIQASIGSAQSPTGMILSVQGGK
jgi:uncharacterized protein (TIGR03437 family)